MFDMVIAKYKEDIKWADKLSCKKFIYNKDDNDYPNSVRLQNFGREAHTWAYHIVKNYDLLNEYTIFVQGDPFYHFKNFIEVAQTLPESFCFLYKYEEGLYGIADINQPEDLDFLKSRKVRPDIVLNYISSKNKKKYVFPFAWGAQYVVHKDNILCKPIEFWQRLVDIDYKNEEHWPWSLERCWIEIFGRDTLQVNKKLFL
jgi:hypothetical protein